MKLYEVFNPDLNASVRFKILNEQETYKLTSQNKNASQEEFMRAVLEAVIYNLKTDVTAAIKKIPKDEAKDILTTLFNCSLMLNPGLDVISWLQIANSPLLISNLPVAMSPLTADKKPPTRAAKKRSSVNKISRTRFLNLDRYLKERIIGQDEAIDELVSALRRSYVGLSDEDRPLGVFIFAGASGVGKTLIAKELHKYLFGETTEMVRVDCGEYQHKHENQKLIGSPPGYQNHEEGGQLTNAMIKNPNTVVLLDEVEKANPDMWNTFLRVFDEGWLTDGAGNKASFHNSIIIMTTNLGNKEIVSDMRDKKVGFKGADQSLIIRDRVIRVTNDAIHKYFRPEFTNRIDKTVVFNHLTNTDYAKIAEIELQSIETKLEKKGYVFTYEDSVIEAMIQGGVNNIEGARGLSQIRRDKIENTLANSLLSKRHMKGTVFNLVYMDDQFALKIQSPLTRKRMLELEAGPTSEVLSLD